MFSTRPGVLRRCWEVFNRHGYHGTSVSMLAEATGLGKSGLMHHHLSKESLMRAVLEYAQETFVIRAHAEPGESWEFKSGITATVSEKKDTLCWGVSDSLKTIELSDGNRLRLSKYFGLLFSDNQTLVGLEGKEKGVQLPVLADFSMASMT